MRENIYCPQLKRNGFTLVELLIVLVILGLMSSVVVMAMPDPRGSVTADAERFAARAKAAQDKAVIDARAVSIRVGPDGYGFETREQGEWRPLAAPPFVDARWGEGTQAAGGGRIVFDPTGIAEPAAVTLVRGEDRATVSIRYDGQIDVTR